MARSFLSMEEESVTRVRCPRPRLQPKRLARCNWHVSGDLGSPSPVSRSGCAG